MNTTSPPESLYKPLAFFTSKHTMHVNLKKKQENCDFVRSKYSSIANEYGTGTFFDNFGDSKLVTNVKINITQMFNLT